MAASRRAWHRHVAVTARGLTLLAIWLGGPALLRAAPVAPADAISVTRFQLEAPAFAPERITVDVYLPPGYAGSHARYPVLYANDGQDMPAVGLLPTLQSLYRQQAITPVIVVAVHMLHDRAAAYGLSDRYRARSVVGGSRIGAIGTRAQDYSNWLATQLVPWVDAHYRSQAAPQGRTVLGWSLGALNAFNVAWQYPQTFGRLGAFSPSFWLSASRQDAAAVQRTRLAQFMVAHTARPPRLKMWFAVGDAEETDDRNHDGINDAVQDVEDLLQGYREGGTLRARGLRQRGYRVDMDGARHVDPRADAVFFLLPGGHHNQTAWKAMLPPFLRWAYGRR